MEKDSQQIKVSKPGKRPLAGYRFIFGGFGVLLITVALYELFLFFTGKGVPTHRFFIPIGLIVGVSYVLFARRLGQPHLTKKHWKLGFLMMAMGVVTGIGIIFIFMALIWTDADVRCHFKDPPNNEVV